jgi:hypothetical protein
MKTSVVDFSSSIVPDNVDSELAEQPPHQFYKDVTNCIRENLIEGCAIGCAAGLIVSAIPVLLRGRLDKLPSAILNKSTIRSAVLFGTLMASTNTSLFLLRGRKSLSPRAVRLLTAVISSSLATAVMPQAVKNFVVYLLVTRALEVLARRAKSQSSETSSPGRRVDVFSSHEIVFLTMGSMTVLITSWIGYPHLLPKSYLHFIDRISNLSIKQVRDMGSILKGEPSESLAHYGRDCGYCRNVHEFDTQQCLVFLARFLVKGLLTRTGPFYAKLYLLPLLISSIRRRRISHTGLRNYLTRVGWSALFLTSMNTTVAGTVCAMSALDVTPRWWTMPLSGLACGTTMYIEQESRRLELALYLFGQALQVLEITYKSKGYYSPPGIQSAVIALSMAIVMIGFWERMEDDHDNIFRETYASLIEKIIDTSNQRHQFRIV